MTDQKIRPCPTCGKSDRLYVFKYDSGWQHVECDHCGYMGHGEGSRREAIRSHNVTFAAPTQPEPTRGQSDDA